MTALSVRRIVEPSFADDNLYPDLSRLRHPLGCSVLQPT